MSGRTNWLYLALSYPLKRGRGRQSLRILAVEEFARLTSAALLAMSLSGCLVMDGTSPILSRTDLSALPDYSGTYLSYSLDDNGRIVPALPSQMLFFDRLSEGEYRFALQAAGDALPTFGGYLYLLDMGVEDEAIGLLYGRSRAGKEQATFLRIRRISEYRFDIAGFIQNDADKYAVLGRVAGRHGIDLDPVNEGRLLGRPSGSELRAAYLDRDFLPNVDFDFDTAMVRQDPDGRWPERVVIKDVASVGLKIVENSPSWRSSDLEGQCSVQYGAADQKPILAVHAVRGRFALEVQFPNAADGASDRVQLQWQVDDARPHTLWSERQVLRPDTLVAFPFENRLLEELARGRELVISARGQVPLRFPLKGSARASIAFAQCSGS